MSTAEPSVIARGRTWIRSAEGRKLFRYASVSAISTVLSLIILYVFLRVIGLDAAWANIVTTMIVTVPNYYLNRAWAWGRTGRSHVMKEVLPFWVIAFVSLALSTVAVVVAKDNAHYLSHARAVQTALIEFANFFTYGVMWIGKYTIFNKILFRHRDELADDGTPVLLVSAAAE